MTNDSDSDSNGIVSRIRQARERISRAESSVRAKRRAKQRRIEKGEPKTLSENVSVGVNNAKETINQVKEETSKTVDEVGEFTETTFGVEVGGPDGATEDGDGGGLLGDIGDFEGALNEASDGALDVSAVEPGDIEPVKLGDDESMTDASDPVMDGDDLL